MRATLKTLMICILALTATVALAQGTPDGETPATEDDCNNQSGAAFGLCNAYCEAMDCELLNDGDLSTFPSASEKACTRVGDKFTQFTGETVPCDDRVMCPCLDDMDWSNYATGELGADSCSDDGTVIALFTLGGAGEVGDGSGVDRDAGECFVIVSGQITDLGVALDAAQLEACVGVVEEGADDQMLDCS